MRHLLLATLLIGLTAGSVQAQLAPRPVDPERSKDLRLHAPLQDAARLAISGRLTGDSLVDEFTRRGFRVDDAGRVLVEIVGPNGGAVIEREFVTSYGGEFEGGISGPYWNRAECRIPPVRLLDCAAALPPDYFIEATGSIIVGDVPGEGPVVVNSAGYPDGAGLTIAIMDLGFDGLTEAVANGDAPASHVQINYTERPFESDEVHGTGCLEAAYDHSPAANYRLYKIDGGFDWISSALDAVTAGVDVFSSSLAKPVNGWHDDEGEAASALNTMATQGVLVFSAAGNHAQEHYQAVFEPGGGSEDWHDFGPGDEVINIDVAAGANLHCNLLWNRDGGTYDYELYLFDTAMNELDSSTNPSDYYEWLNWTNDTGSAMTVLLAVLEFDGGATEFEIYTKGGSWQQFYNPWSSVPAPGNATQPNVLIVGAVPHEDYGHGSGQDWIAASYSGHGPTNDGSPVPDLCGPTNTATLAYGGPMGGTSNSTPNCAGAAAAFWSADLQLNADAVRWLTVSQAALWKDWGAQGFDLVYGHGGMILDDFVPNRLWVAREFNNLGNERIGPFYTIADALSWAPAGWRVQVFPGGDYPENLTIDQSVIVDTTEDPTFVGTR